VLAALALLPLNGSDLLAGIVSPTYALVDTCDGDCDDNNAVTVDEILTGINIALGLASLERCTSVDIDGNGVVTVDELLLAVQGALEGCALADGAIEIISPANGGFTQQESVAVLGRVTSSTITALVSVNGSPTEPRADGTFSADVPLDPELILNPVLAEVSDQTNGFIDRDRIVVVAGDSIPAGEPVDEGVALRLTDSGLAKLEASLPSILDLDADALIAPGTIVVNNYCVIDSPFGCIERVDVVAESASVDSVTVDLDSIEGFLAAEVTLGNLVVPLEIRGSVFDCDGRAMVELVRIAGNYELAPLPEAGSIDVNVVGNPVIEITGDTFDFTGGACDDDPIDDLIRAVIGDFRPRLRAALEEYLNDPDGAGPEDAPVAAAMQSGLSAVDFTAPLGEAFGIVFETAYFGIAADAGGVTFGSDALASAPPPAVPLFPASYRVDEPFPSLSSTTPIAGAGFDIGLCVSTSTLNQMIKAVMEAGGLRLDLTELDFGSGDIPITGAALSLILPEAQSLDPGLPITLRFQPTVPPILTEAQGPAGELADLRVAGLLFEVISDAAGVEVVHLRAALDARAAFDLTFEEEDGRRLRIALTPPRPDDIVVTVLDDGLGVDEARLQANLPRVVARFVNLLSRELGAFDLPVLFGLQAGGLEVSRAGRYPCMFLVLPSAGSLRARLVQR
jgi:hypothetical protein